MQPERFVAVAGAELSAKAQGKSFGGFQALVEHLDVAWASS